MFHTCECTEVLIGVVYELSPLVALYDCWTAMSLKRNSDTHSADLSRIGLASGHFLK